MKVAFVNTACRKGLSFDDALLATAMAERGYETCRVFWDAPGESFEAADLYINRSTFEYHKHPRAFREWLDRIEARRAPLLNPVSAIRSNLCKSYLQEIRAGGGSIIPALFLRGVTAGAVRDAIKAEGWDDVVLKPFVGAASYNLLRVQAHAIQDAALAPFQQEHGLLDVIVQPFWNEFGQDGELSFVFLGERYSHAILKRPAAGDFRVQGRFGGTCERFEAPAGAVAQARDILRASGLSQQLLYARVDGVFRDGRFYLSELEINEPWLFFTEAPEACGLFIDRMEDMMQQQTKDIAA